MPTAPCREPRYRTATLIALALLASPAVAATATGALPAGPASEDDGLGTRNLWPIYERATLENGRTRRMFCYLWTWTTNPDGTTASYSLLNWIDSPTFTSLLPIYYQVGPPERRRTMLVPLWFQGPGYGVAPLALTGSWRRAEGGRTTWVTPLAHVSTGADGAVTSMHAGPYVQSGSFRMVFPIAGAGQDAWAAPLALSGGWRHAEGGSTTWVTPLFHWTRKPDGSTDHLHALTYLRVGDTQVLLPLGWIGRYSYGLLPLVLGGTGWWVAPAVLSASWRNDQGGHTTWVTPLAHAATDGSGRLSSLHVGPYIHTAAADVLFPCFWSVGRTGSRTHVVLPIYYAYGPADRRTHLVVPLWFRSPGGWVAPPLLTAAWSGDDGGRNLWVTPLFHAARDATGERRSFHAGLWFRGQSAGGSYDVLFPVAYRRTVRDGTATRTHVGVLPAWVSGPGYGGSPALLTGWWRRAAGGTTVWATPLFHQSTRADGSVQHRHVGLWFDGSIIRPSDAAGRPDRTDYRVAFPVYYHRADTAGGVTESHDGIVPVWFSGPGYSYVPLAFTGWWRQSDGGSTTWVTPLFHRTTDRDGTTTSLHAMNYIRSGDLEMLFPLAYRRGPAGQRSGAILPLWFQGPGYGIAPLALSWWNRRDDGSTALWITPLFHQDRGADGQVRHQHVGPWIQTPSTTVVLPAFYAHRAGDGTHWGLIPAWFQGPGYAVAPPALSWWRRRSDGSTSTWVTPLAHVDRKPDGSVADLHVLTYVHTGTTRVLAPFAWLSGPPERRHFGVLPIGFGGPGYAVAPLAMTAWWKRQDGSSELWVTPLFSRATDASGATTRMHVATWIHTPTSDAVLPLYFSGPGYRVFLPFVVQRGDSWAAPLLLSARWTAERRTTTWVTPLVHWTTEHGAVRHLHAGPYIQARHARTVFPLWWSWDRADHGASSLLAPLWLHNRDGDGSQAHTVLPLGATWRSGSTIDTSIARQLTPFLVQNTTEGVEVNVLWRLFHVRDTRVATETEVFPFWWSEHRPGEPARWGGLLGGLFFNRDCNYEKKVYRYYTLFRIPVSGRIPFSTTQPSATTL